MQIFWHTNNGLEAGKLMPKSEKKLKLMIMVFVDLLLLTSNQLVPPSLWNACKTLKNISQPKVRILPYYFIILHTAGKSNPFMGKICKNSEWF